VRGIVLVVGCFLNSDLEIDSTSSASEPFDIAKVSKAFALTAAHWALADVEVFIHLLLLN
jgi:hypothetical protein